MRIIKICEILRDFKILLRQVYFHPSILLALQPWVSLGLLNYQPPLLSIHRLRQVY